MTVDKKLNNKGHSLAITALKVIHINGGSMARSDIIDAVKEARKKEGRPIPPEQEEKKDGKGSPRWIVQMDAYSSDYVSVELLVKENRTWSLTSKCTKLLEKIKDEYNIWQEYRRLSKEKKESSEQTREPEIPQETQESSGDKIADYIKNMSWRDLEFFVGALLTGMGYYVKVQSGSKDGGVDVIAYKDKLGASMPRLKVQVKQHGQPAGEDVMRRLKGVLNEGDIGVFVSPSGFTKDAIKFARATDKHIELISVDDLVNLWTEHYSKISEKDQKRLPLIYVIDESELQRMEKE